MDAKADYDNILIREANILVRLPPGYRVGAEESPEFFDVRTGVQLRTIHPPLQASELDRGLRVSDKTAGVIMKTGTTVIILDPTVDQSKVVTIWERKQRKLDGVVADSILDQLERISGLLRDVVNVAGVANNEERFWLSQQVLTLVRKFSGRELEELEELVEWFNKRPSKR